MTMDGYQPFEMALTRSVSGWVWGNIVFGGLIGLAVDAITGGLYKVAPEQLTAELTADGAALQVSEGGEVLLVTVVLRPTDEAGDPDALIVRQGTHAHPDVSLVLGAQGYEDMNFAGRMSGETQITGTLNGSGFDDFNFNLGRR